LAVYLVAEVSDFTDLQAQVLARRAELERAWQVQVAIKVPSGSIAKDYPDLSSRAWDFAHENAPNVITASAADTRGRKLLEELHAMGERFQKELGPEANAAMPAYLPPAPSADPSQASTFPSFFGLDSGELIIAAIVVALVVLNEKRGGW